MAATVVDFKARFLEFSKLPDSTIAAYLSDAAVELDENVWGALFDQGVMLLAASRLCMSPYAQQAKLADSSGDSSYLAHYQRLQRRVAMGVGRLARAT